MCFRKGIVLSFREWSRLIEGIFEFLVILSYERTDKGLIIGVPKILQLIDGLLASGDVKQHGVTS